MSQSSAFPARNTRPTVRLWRNDGRPAHADNMVADILILMALAAAPMADTASSGRVDVRATATIRHGITVQGGSATTRAAEAVPIRQKPRDCHLVDKTERAPSSDCRLIVYDLP